MAGVNHHEIMKRLGLESLPSKIVDDETGEVILPDQAKLQRAIRIISRVQSDIIIIAELIKEFFGDKLYLYLGMTKEEAARVCFGMSPSAVLQIERIGDSFGGELGNYAYLGVTRLDTIAKLPEHMKQEFFNTKKLRFADGTVITLDDIRDESIAELQKKIKKLTKEKSDLKVNIDEMEKNETEYEHRLKLMQNENDDLLKMIDIPPDEQQFHKKIISLADARKKMTEAQSTVFAAFMMLKQIDVNERNREVVTAGVKGIMTFIAETMTDIEAQFDISLAPQKTRVLELAE